MKILNFIIFINFFYFCLNQTHINNNNIKSNKTNINYSFKIPFTNIFLSNYASFLYSKIANYNIKINEIKKDDLNKENSNLFSSIKYSMIVSMTKAVYKNFYFINLSYEIFIIKALISIFIAFLINTNLYLLRKNPKLRDLLRILIVFYSNLSCCFDIKTIDAYFFIIKQVITFLSYFPIKYFINKFIKNKLLNSLFYAIICSIFEFKIISLINLLKNYYLN